MMTVVLCDLGDEREVVAEERQAWLQRVLVALGADEKVVSENTMAAREHLMLLGLDVFKHVDGSVKVYRPEYVTFELPSEDPERQVDEIDVETRQKLVAEWNPPEIVRIREGPGKEHCRITLREWALPFQMEEV
jgi:hypothetical protein